LVNANILSAASWSIIFTTGMALGGLATGYLGTDPVFIINSVSYVLSAWFIYKASIPQKEMSDEEKRRTSNPVKGIKDGFRFLLHNKHVLRPTIAKGTFTFCSGALVYMLIIVAEDVLMMGSIGLGFLCAARGIGTGIGPVAGRRIFKRESRWILAMGLFMVICGMFYMVVSLTETLIVMLLFVLLAHMASGANWVMSTVLLQRRAPDVYRGGAFSTEWFLFTLSQSLSVTIASLILEFGWLTIQQTISVFSILLCLVGVVWLIRVVPAETRYHGEVKAVREEEKVIHQRQQV